MKLATPVNQPAAIASPYSAQAASWRGGLTAAYASEVGSGHTQNEDCCSHVPAADHPRFCGVADGVGGGAHGEIASSTLLAHCAEAPPEVVRDSVKLVDWLIKADAKVREAIARRSDRLGAATLAAVWFASPATAMVANVGDCRVYRLRPQRDGYSLEQLTVDQTYARLEQEPPRNGSANDPARMVGAGAMGRPPVIKIRLRECDLLLLCSDGVHKFVGADEIAGIVKRGIGEGRTLRRICAALVGAAQNNGSLDDASALLVWRRPRFGLRWLAPAILVALLVLWLSLIQSVTADEVGAWLDPHALWLHLTNLLDFLRAGSADGA
jgi:PPM family protein phosphatase